MNWLQWTATIIGGLGFLYALLRGVLAIGEWKGKTDTSVKALKEAIAEIRDDVKRILGMVGPRAIGDGSPLRLTDLGKGISEDINAAAWAKQQGQRLSEKVAGMAPYDIQKFCFGHVRSDQFDPGSELLEKMKASAYNRGTTFEQVENVLAIKLRDVLLEIHGLEPPETDTAP